MKVANNTLINL